MAVVRGSNVRDPKLAPSVSTSYAGRMAGQAHDVLIAALTEQPTLLDALVAKLTGGHVPRGLAPADAAVRFVNVAEVRVDLLLRRGRRWTIVEIQRGIDPKKRRRWLLAVSLLVDQGGALGDLVVITPRAHVARWAKRVVHMHTSLGTKVSLEPVVLLLGDAEVEALLDEEHPELALFAAWAMQDRHGPRARSIVERAVELTDRLPRRLRDAQVRAILSVLSERMLALLREASMNPDKIPETPAAKKLRLFLEAQGRKRGRAEGIAEGKAEGIAEGKQEALLTILRARGLRPQTEDVARIQGCADVAKLDLWIERAATAASVREVLGAKSSPPARRKVQGRTRTAHAAR